MNPVIVDPLVDKEEVLVEYNIKLKKEIPKDKIFKAIIVAVAHNQFKYLQKKDWEIISDKNGVIIDIKNVIPKNIEAIRL